MFHWKILSASVALFLMGSVRAETNVTIDDTDPRINYQPPGVWLFESNSVFTQDRWNKTTHYTSELGATASLTFTDALYVYYIGYGIKEMPPPALVPITLQPKHGSAVTVQSESYRPAGAQAQIILFSSNRLDPMETYTITVTKSNATLGNGVNIDAFLLTKPDGANSTSSPAETTTSAQPSSVANSPNGGMIAGVVVAIVIGILVACLILRWWLKRNRQKPVPVGPDGLPITNETSRPAYFSAAPPYSSKGTSSSPQNTNPAVADHHLYTQRRVDTPPSLAPTRAPGQMSGHNEMIQVQQTLSYTPLAQGKARYMGNNPPSHLAPTPTSSSYAVPSSPEDTENRGAMLPAYSPHQV